MAKMNGNKTNKGRGFDANPQNINRKGQPRKLLRAINDELNKEGFERVTASQVAEAYELLLNLPEDKVRAYGKDKSMPMLMRLVAKQMTGKYGIFMIESMLNRAHGNSKSSVDLTTKGQSLNKPMDLTKLTNEELDQLDKLTQKISGD